MFVSTTTTQQLKAETYNDASWNIFISSSLFRSMGEREGETQVQLIKVLSLLDTFCLAALLAACTLACFDCLSQDSQLKSFVCFRVTQCKFEKWPWHNVPKKRLGKQHYCTVSLLSLEWLANACRQTHEQLPRMYGTILYSVRKRPNRQTVNRWTF